jgi:carboxymethylenebutenolidase
MTAQPQPDVPGAVREPDTLSFEDVEIPAEPSPLYGYLVRQTAAGSLPAVIVLHELFGINEHIRDVTRRLANVGYVALAPSLYRDLTDGDAVTLEEGRARLMELADAQVTSDLAACAGYLRGRDDTTGKVGAIGFCSGGRFTLVTACTMQALDAAIDCWGGFITRADPEHEHTLKRPTTPVELAAGGLHCPLLAVFGAEDNNPSPADAEALRRALYPANSQMIVRVFGAAGHAFFADYRPSYRPGPAHLLWEEIVLFLRRHLTA